MEVVPSPARMYTQTIRMHTLYGIPEVLGVVAMADCTGYSEGECDGGSEETFICYDVMGGKGEH